MDLSFRLPDAAAESALPAADMDRLVAMLADRQAASATAQAQAQIGAGDPVAEVPLAPVHGAFNTAMASQLTMWRQE